MSPYAISLSDLSGELSADPSCLTDDQWRGALLAKLDGSRGDLQASAQRVGIEDTDQWLDSWCTFVDHPPLDQETSLFAAAAGVSSALSFAAFVIGGDDASLKDAIDIDSPLPAVAELVPGYRPE